MLNEITLSSHQVEKLDEINEELLAGRKRIVLSGSAGVGKTTLVHFLIADKINEGRIFIAAPTHKALSVLKQKINYDTEMFPIEYCTVHKGLKLKMNINKKTGKKTFEQKYSQNDPPFKECQLLIIDEASMLNQKMIDLLEQYEFSIIFLGDEKQINPVKEIDSPVFHQNWKTVTLTEIIRQGAGNPVIELSRNLNSIWEGEANFSGEEEKEGYLYTNDRQKIIHKLAQVNGTDKLKYLAWTNTEVDSMNFSVRSAIYGNPEYIEQGETLVLNARYVISQENVLHNNFELKVETLKVANMNFFCGDKRFEYKVYVVNDKIFAIHEAFIVTHRQNMRTLKAMAINRGIGWKEYYAFEEKFLDFKYNHAITIHKSQGSTYTDVIINIKDVMRNRKAEERNRLLYTAITRTSKLLILYNV